ncbi:MAG: molybdate ABC transporter substrate-binding protein [Hyphomicrobiales bacterium]|nr:molybdate ABC transporter substrate-binding protein [Hyphomicrobiales bacterium]
MTKRAGFFALLLALAPLAGRAEGPAPASAGAATAQSVTVFAAASLRNALDEAAAAWKAATGKDAKISYAASFPLAKQIEAGAPADIFISADEASMDYLDQRKLLAPGSRANFLGNSLVVVAPRDSATDALPFAASAWSATLGQSRLAIGDPASVPAGKYARAALQKLDLWSALEPRLALTDNVRSALLFVSRGEAPLGVVYATDAAADAHVKIVATFPAGSHPPIVYPIALTATAQGAAPAQFLAFLRSAAARPYFEKQGFTLNP